MPFVPVPSTESAEYINSQKSDFQDTYYVDNLNALGGGGGGGGGDVTLLGAYQGNVGATSLIIPNCFDTNYTNFMVRASVSIDSAPMMGGNLSIGCWDSGSASGATFSGINTVSTTMSISTSSFNGNYGMAYADYNALNFGATLNILAPQNNGAFKSLTRLSFVAETTSGQNYVNRSSGVGFTGSPMVPTQFDGLYVVFNSFFPGPVLSDCDIAVYGMNSTLPA